MATMEVELGNHSNHSNREPSRLESNLCYDEQHSTHSILPRDYNFVTVNDKSFQDQIQFTA